jgi:hypothetical protein
MTNPQAPQPAPPDDGGPAFPHPDYLGSGQYGMSLRDYFAAKALMGMLANQHPYQASDEHMFARDAYVLADAMLKARGGAA